ncbi:MAG: DNA mismatch repair protein MutS [Verrucomicrobia bacterium]|nr:DNA mismatch repair protein MutS [Verrucomicrobiota bacterium]
MTITPMMSQWHACKKKAEGALLLFRLGDFYEAFEDDALILAKELDLVLTKRQETPMAGIPAHTCETYIDRLVSRGFRVAVAEQMEDPKEVKGIVKREIVRLITPGSVINSSLLNDKSHNFLACLAQVNSIYGLAILDLTTADFRVMEFQEDPELLDELGRLDPKEIVVSEKCFKHLSSSLEELKISSTLVREEWHFDHQFAYDSLVKHFQVHTLDGFGLKGMTAAINAAGALMTYVKDDLNLHFGHIKAIHPHHLSKFMALDRITQRHLELIDPLHDKGKTLLQLLDETATPMGGRLLKEWLLHPLLSVDEIQVRQDHVEKFFRASEQSSALQKSLKEVRDLERLIMRIETGYATPRDLAGLRFSLEPLPEISKILIQLGMAGLTDFSALTQKIKAALVDAPPLRLSDGGIFRPGYDPELDALKILQSDSQTWLASYQTKLREEVQIKTLKVGYTQAFGYYIEVSRGQSEKMPLSFQRRQTLVNTERYISPELKEFEHKILTAEDKITFLENRLFQELRSEIAAFAETIRTAAKWIAEIDVYLSLAKVAREQRYTRPLLDNSDSLHIVEGRHPVIEASLEREAFIPNDVQFDPSQRLLVITGPNMAGKSTYIRQVALIALLAQIGSFVPAKCAQVGVIDKLFTRIGASDDLSRGQSTFMVEMSETANILNNATSRSLVILDEIGRGTSTYDGIAIAWSVADYLLTEKGKQAKTLFATHYFELTQLEEEVPGAVNYNVAVHESEKGIVFLRKIVKGGTDKSYGIHVAKLAGLPFPVVKKAQEMLDQLHATALKNAKKPSKPQDKQLDLF